MSDGYNEFLLGHYGELPDDPEALKRGLRTALKIIGSYELDCRHIEEYVTPENMGRGFCQGDIYVEAVADIFYWMRRDPNFHHQVNCPDCDGSGFVMIGIGWDPEHPEDAEDEDNCLCECHVLAPSVAQ